MDTQENNFKISYKPCVTLGELREKLDSIPDDTLISINSTFGVEFLVVQHNTNLILDFQEPI